MQTISFSQTLLHDFPSSFEFDALSFMLKERLKKHNVFLISNFSFGGNEGIPPELPRIQLNDELGYYSISVSMKSVEFRIDSSSFDMDYKRFSVLAQDIRSVLVDRGVEPSKHGVSAAVVFPMESPSEYIKKHIFNESNSFLRGDLIARASISVTDAIRVGNNIGLLRITQISDAFKMDPEGGFDTYVHVSREINNFPTGSPNPNVSYVDFIEIGLDQFSEESLKEVIEME